MGEWLSESAVVVWLRHRVPEIFAVAAVLFIVGSMINGDQLLVFVGVVWLLVAGYLYHQRDHPPAPPKDRP